VRWFRVRFDDGDWRTLELTAEHEGTKWHRLSGPDGSLSPPIPPPPHPSLTFSQDRKGQLPSEEGSSSVVPAQAAAKPHRKGAIRLLSVGTSLHAQADGLPTPQHAADAAEPQILEPCHDKCITIGLRMLHSRQCPNRQRSTGSRNSPRRSTAAEKMSSSSLQPSTLQNEDHSHSCVHPSVSSPRPRLAPAPARARPTKRERQQKIDCVAETAKRERHHKHPRPVIHQGGTAVKVESSHVIQTGGGPAGSIGSISSIGGIASGAAIATSAILTSAGNNRSADRPQMAMQAAAELMLSAMGSSNHSPRPTLTPDSTDVATRARQPAGNTAMLSEFLSRHSAGGSASSSTSGSSLPSVSPSVSPLTPDPQKSPTSLSLEALAGLASSEKSPNSRKHLAAAAAGLLRARGASESEDGQSLSPRDLNPNQQYRIQNQNQNAHPNQNHMPPGSIVINNHMLYGCDSAEAKDERDAAVLLDSLSACDGLALGGMSSSGKSSRSGSGDSDMMMGTSSSSRSPRKMSVSDYSKNYKSDEEIGSGGGRIGIYTPEARKQLLQKWHRKRTRRVWTKKVRYSCRKQVADNRIRIKGRFVKVVHIHLRC